MNLNANFLFTFITQRPQTKDGLQSGDLWLGIDPFLNSLTFVMDGRCLACRYNLTDKLRTQTDAGQL